MRKISDKKIQMGFFFLIILMILFYNHIRIHSSYDFGLLNKEVSLNFIPFHRMGKMVFSRPDKILLKIFYFTMIGSIIKIDNLLIYRGNKKRLLFCISIAFASTEILYLFSSGVPTARGLNGVNIDVNNWIIYLLGLLLGSICVSFLNKIVSRCKITEKYKGGINSL